MSDYCIICRNRSDKGLPEELRRTDRGTKCMIGYTQNPKTLEATINVYRNKGEVCPQNPFIDK